MDWLVWQRITFKLPQQNYSERFYAFTSRMVQKLPATLEKPTTLNQNRELVFIRAG